MNNVSHTTHITYKQIIIFKINVNRFYEKDEKNILHHSNTMA